MASINCGPLPSFVYKRYLKEPLDEGIQNFRCLREAMGKQSDGASLLNRTSFSNLVKGTILLVPAVNVVALRVFSSCGMTLRQSFENAVATGNELEVQRYLAMGLDPNAESSDGRPLLFHTTSPAMIRALLIAKADPKRQAADGTRFLEHLLLNRASGLAKELADEGLIEVRPYLNERFFERVKNNKAARSFILRMGYDAPLEVRQAYGFELITELDIERAIMYGNVRYFEGLIRDTEGLKTLEKNLVELSRELPKLRTEWIWEHVLKGYLESHQRDIAVVQRILFKQPRAQHVQVRGKQLLLHLLARGLGDEARQLCVDGLVDPEPYYPAESYRDKHNDIRTFLLQIGFKATVEDRKQGAGITRTKNPLEPLILTGNVEALRALLKSPSIKRGFFNRRQQPKGRNFENLATLDKTLGELKELFPLLYTDWIWEYVLDGYCEGRPTNQIDDYTVITLLNRGGKIEALDGLNLKGRGLLLEKLIASGKESLAALLVRGKVPFCPLTSYFDATFLDCDYLKNTTKPRELVWFLVKMGYPEIVRTYQVGRYQPKLIENILEKAVITCDGDALRVIISKNSLAKILEAYEALKEKQNYPHLNTPWVWEVVGNAYWQDKKYEDLVSLVNQGLYIPSDRFFQDNAYGQKFFDAPDAEKYKTLMRVGYRGGPLLRSLDPIYLFEEMAYAHDTEAVLRLARENGFQTIYDRFLEMKCDYPKMDMSWMWNALFTIPSSHFEQFQRIQRANEVPSPPVEYSLGELVTLFDRIKFDKVPKSMLTNGRQLGRDELRRLAEKVKNSINAGFSAYNISAQEKAKYLKQLRWIIHYLKEDLGDNQYLSERAGNAYAAMFTDCVACHSRWTEAFDNTRRQLGNIEMQCNGLEEQLQIPLGEHRLFIKDQLAQLAGGDTHRNDDLIYHLRESRGLPCDPIYNPLGGGNQYYPSHRAHADFDARYTPGSIIETLYEKTRGDQDFYELLVDTFGARLAPQWREQNRELRRRAVERGLKEKVTFDELEALGLNTRGMQRTPFELADFVADLNGWGLDVSFPEGCTDTLDDLFFEAQSQAKASLDKKFIKKWTDYGLSKGVFGEDEKPTKNQIYMKFTRCRDPIAECSGLNTPVTEGNATTVAAVVAADSRQQPDTVDVVVGMADQFKASGHVTLEAFYRKHPEIPESLKRLDLVTKTLNETDVKKHLIAVAYTLKYSEAPYEIGKYLQEEEQGIFREVLVPMNGYEVALQGKIHPLILAKLLTDMGHLQPTVPTMFDGVFSSNLDAPMPPALGRGASQGRRIPPFQVLLAMGALYGAHKFIRSTAIGSPKWFYNKFIKKQQPPPPPPEIKV